MGAVIKVQAPENGTRTNNRKTYNTRNTTSITILYLGPPRTANATSSCICRRGQPHTFHHAKWRGKMLSSILLPHIQQKLVEHREHTIWLHPASLETAKRHPGQDRQV
mmetsp:Transcript_43080/g.84950  ORF Transcript_43080/g.84950 Transcript_43080/m.84950 type:complete len:108 (-) Transcript_43080:929-1252(-)